MATGPAGDIVPSSDSGVGTQGTAEGIQTLNSAAANVEEERGTAYIYANSAYGRTTANEIAEAYIKWFDGTGLKVRSKLSSESCPKPMYERSLQTDHVLIFMIWESDQKKTLEAELQSIEAASFSSDTPKLLIFCREVEPFTPLNDDLKAEIQLATNLLPRCKAANIFLLYMAGVAADLKQFLNELMTQYQQDEDLLYKGGYPCISSIAPSKLFSSSQRETFRCINGLAEGKKLRIEARSFANCLLRNSTDLIGQRTWEEFDPFEADKEDTRQDDETYENNGDGHVLIISNEKFHRADHRRGARIDLQNLEDLFSKLKLNRNVKIHRDMTAAEMKIAVKNFARGEHYDLSSKNKSSFSHGSFAILIILSHGSGDQVVGVDEDEDEDEAAVNVEEIIRPIASCSSLAGRPKLVIINACRGGGGPDEAGTREYTYAAPLRISQTQLALNCAMHFHADKGLTHTSDNSPDTAGLIVAFATTHGNPSYGLGFSGSRFINALCQTLYQRARDHHVVSMIGQVNYLMTRLGRESKPEKPKQQISSWIVETTKNFYLVRTRVLKTGQGGTEPEE